MVARDATYRMITMFGVGEDADADSLTSNTVLSSVNIACTKLPVVFLNSLFNNCSSHEATLV